MTDIISQQQDGDLWHFRIGGVAVDGVYRIASVSRETTSPAEWLAANPEEAQNAIDIGGISQGEYDEGLDFSDLNGQITTEIAWIGGAIQDIDTGLAIANPTQAQVLAMVRGLMTNQRRVLVMLRVMLRAWRYVVRRLA